MAEKTVATRGQPRTTTVREETRSQEQYVTPPVDIYETGDGLVVKADLPGVSKDDLEVRVENNILTIRGKPSHIAPGDPIYREYRLASFFRQFELSEKVDQTKIAADLKHGVLSLTLPKAEEAKPRRIEVKIA
ncbi:MAG TPA: Hsp20/alpha crystallin family protein [candidate division Zixibacteria bacterium]|nr:Hsp20/alpha crystallin family protein [candidate division Zixibacteria bacterium]